MEDLSLLLEIGFKEDFIGFLFGFTEDDGSSMPATVEVDDVGDDGISMVVGAVKGHVFNGFGGFHTRILN